MSLDKALAHKSNLEKMNNNMNKQGLSKEEKRTRIFAYLDETKRKHLKEEKKSWNQSIWKDGIYGKNK